MKQEEFYSAMAARYQMLTGAVPDEASDTAIRFCTLAAELERLSVRLEEAERQSSPRTASGEALDRFALCRGIARRPSLSAHGTLRFARAGAKGAVTISAGTVCLAKDGAAYRTLESVLLEEQTVSAAAQAVRAGAAGNAAAGAVERMTGIAGVCVENPEPFTGGRDAEEDEQLRKRVLDAYAAPDTGINAAYYQTQAQAVEGVQSAVCVAGETPGEITVCLAGTDGAVSEAVKTEVSEQLNLMREPFAAVTVRDADILSTDIALAVENADGVSGAAAENGLRDAITSYLSNLAVGEKLTLAAITRLIVYSGLAKNWKLTAPAQDVEPGVAQAVRAGTVTVTAGEG